MSKDNVFTPFFESKAFYNLKFPIYKQIIKNIKPKTNIADIISTKEIKSYLGSAFRIPKKLQYRFLKDMEKHNFIKRINQRKVKVLV